MVNSSTMKRIATAAVPLLALSLTGCGGSGSATDTSAPTPGGPTRAATTLPAPDASAAAPLPPFTPLALVLTGIDAATPTWSHVWARVHKVEGLGADDKPISLFSSGDGYLVDMTSPTPLPGAGAPAATLPRFTRLRLTLAPALQMVKPGQSTAETLSLFPSLAKDTEGRAIATLTLPKPFDGSAPLTLAADLTKLIATEGKAGLSLTLADAPAAPLALTVAGILRGSQLVVAGGGHVELQKGTTTRLYNADGSPSPKCTDGARASVTGLLSLDGKTLLAQRIVLGAAEVTALVGTTSEVDSKQGTFTLTVSRITGALPTRLSALVTLDEKAVLRSRGGLVLERAALWSALAEKGVVVELEGTYEAVTGAFTARRVTLQGSSSPEVRVVGTISVDAASGALTLVKPTAWDGFAPGEQPLPLTTTAATRYTDSQGAELGAAPTLAALKDHTAEVVGLLTTEGKLTVTHLSLGAALPKPAAPPPDAKGT